MAVASIHQRDTSAIATLKSSGKSSPKDLDGATYGSYAARYEGRLVQEMIKNAGGTGDYQEVVKPMLDLWPLLLRGEIDATWIFEAHEGILAQRAGVELNVFKMADYGVPYGAAPVLTCLASVAAGNPAAQGPSSPTTLRALMRAIAQGYQYAADHPTEAAALLVAEAAKDGYHGLDVEVAQDSQKVLSRLLRDPSGKWGTMAPGLFGDFVNFLSKKGMLTTKMQSREGGEGVTSLDGLRGGDVGEEIALEDVGVETLSTNAYLP